MTELDWAAIQRRVGSARTWAALQVDLDDSQLPPNVREHFDRDVPALVDAIRRLEQANAELIAALDETRARMRAAETVVSAANAWADAWDHCMTKGDEEENASVFHAAENALLITLRPGTEN